MKLPPLYELIFALDTPATKALIYEFALLLKQPTVLFELATAVAKETCGSGTNREFRSPSRAVESLGDFHYGNEVVTCQLG